MQQQQLLVASGLQGLGGTALVLGAHDVLLHLVMALLLCQQLALHPLLGCMADAVREINRTHTTVPSSG